MTLNGGLDAKVLEAAIDVTPGQSIKAGDTGQTTTAVPEPPTLALLALGAAGLLTLRKKKQVEAEASRQQTVRRTAHSGGRRYVLDSYSD